MRERVLQPESFITHAASLRQAFAHCERFSTAASRRSLGSVSVLIVQKAGDFAKTYPHVTIIEDTWQNALKDLGVFDCIFFVDYPLESQQYLEKIEKESQESSLIVKQVELLIKEINQQFPNLSTQMYSDQDLDDFVKAVVSEPEEQLITFLQQLYSKKQISNFPSFHYLYLRS